MFITKLDNNRERASSIFIVKIPYVSPASFHLQSSQLLLPHVTNVLGFIEDNFFVIKTKFGISTLFSRRRMEKENIFRFGENFFFFCSKFGENIFPSLSENNKLGDILK